jgi:hypothetical protein
MTDPVEWLDKLQEESFAGANAATAGSFPAERRLSGARIAGVFRTRRNAVVSTTRRDGRPHSTPSSFVLFGTAIWLPVLAKAARAAHVRRQPWISMVIAEGQLETHGVVIVEGPAELVTQPPEGLIEAARAKLGGVAWVERWIRLQPERLLSYASAGWREEGV